MILRRKKEDKLDDSSRRKGAMIETCQGSANGIVMQKLPSKVPGADDGAMMEFKDEIEDEFDDLNDDLEQVKGEVEGDRISLKSPINNKDAFEIVDEFMEEESDSKENGNVSGDEAVKSEDDVADELNGDFNPLELCENAEDLDDAEEVMDDEESVDPLLDEASQESDQQSGKRKLEEPDDNVMVRKSSRLRSKAESRELNNSKGSPDKPKQKMLQKPSERPSQIGLDEEDVESSDMEVTEDVVDSNKENVEQLGDPSRAPGKDANKLIDYDFLQPFLHGWARECVYKETKSGPPVIENIFYWPPSPKEDLGNKAREAKRKRKNKHDQERYFEDFPSEVLSVNNFSYVKRELGLNNEAYEKISRFEGMETRGEARRSSRKVASYKEVPEHQGLLENDDSEGESSDGGVEEVTDFDIGLPLTLQILRRTTPYREEHRKRKRYPDRRRCVTPPLAADISWTQLDDDPLGVWTELRDDYNSNGWPTPEVPAPLRALRLTHPNTVTSIHDKVEFIRSSLVDPLDRIMADNKDLKGSEHLSSHDLAIKKFKHFSNVNRLPVRPSGTAGNFMGSKKPPPPSLLRPGQQRPGQPPASNQGFVKVRLPMQSSNGKRPVVELVMLTNGKYQPIKFTNNRQVTEAIPKRLFDQANTLRKTLYQRSVQVPKIGTKQVFLAINPTPGGVKPYSSVSGHNQQKPAQQPSQAKPAAPSDQVSILVRPSAGGNAVLLNVPRNVALKVKIGTTLSFSASTDQKYTVIDNKLHPPVGKQKQQSAAPSNHKTTAKPATNTHKPPPSSSSRIPSLPSGVSIRPVAPGGGARQSVTSGRPSPATSKPLPPPSLSIHAQIARKPMPQLQPRPTPRQEPVSNFTPCSPFCPGVTGIPELECGQCHSLFHPKCVGIPAWQVANIQGKFKCKACAGGSMTEIIDLE